MPFNRRRVQTAFIALLALGIAGSPGSPVRAQDKPKIALIMKSLANEFFRTMEDGARAHQKANADAYTLLANGIKNETDTAAQIKMIEQAVAQKVNAIVLAPSDSKALVPVLKSAIDKGIIVVNIDNRLDAAALKEKNINVPFVGPDNRLGAKMAGEYLARRLKAGDKVGIIEGIATAFNGQQRSLGHHEAMKAAGITVASVQSGQWEIEKGNTVAAGMLREHPDLVALLAGNDSMALGAVAAIKAAGKTGKVLVVGYDNIGAIAPLLADGRMLASVEQYAAKQAVFGIELAQKAIAAKTPQAQLPAVMQTDVVLSTKDSR